MLNEMLFAYDVYWKLHTPGRVLHTLGRVLSCGEGAYRKLLFKCWVVLTVLKSIHPRRGKKNANFERADFFSISSELKIHGGLPNESLISDKSFSSKLLKTISLLKMTILKFVAKHLRIGILINQ